MGTPKPEPDPGSAGAGRPDADAAVAVDATLRREIRARIARLVANPDDVEDLTQETLLRVVRGACEAGCDVFRDSRGDVACCPKDGSGA